MTLRHDSGYVVVHVGSRLGVIADVASVQPVVEELEGLGIVVEKAHSFVLSLLPVLVVEIACEVFREVA